MHILGWLSDNALHRRVASIGLRVFGQRQLLREGSFGFDVLHSNEPRMLRAFAYAVICGWIVLAIGIMFLFIAIGIIFDRLFGSSTRPVGAAILLGAVFFCAAGAADATIRLIFFVPATQRTHDHVGVGEDRVRHEPCHARSRNWSLAIQVVAASVGVALSLHR